MKLQELLARFQLSSLKISAPFLQATIDLKDADRDAAWDLYIELITRVATQHLDPGDGDEAAALDSIYQLFGLTRETIKRNGREAINFTKIAVVVLNQKIRPFTAKWHPVMLEGPLDPETRQHFRNELRALQVDMRNYTKLLAELAQVEDLTDLEGLETH